MGRIMNAEVSNAIICLSLCISTALFCWHRAKFSFLAKSLKIDYDFAILPFDDNVHELVLKLRHFFKEN